MVSKKFGMVCGTVAALLAGTAVAHAEDSISGAAGVSYNSHFVSYGADVWGGGSEFFGDRSTTFTWVDMNIGVGDANINFGAWGDINDNAGDTLGGNIQEIDIYGGASYSFSGVTAGFTYQEWYYAGDTEKILDFAFSYDDTGLIAPDFALNPKLVWHIRLEGNGAQRKGSAIVLSVAPSFPITEMVSLKIPAGIAFFADADFQGGTEGGYGYSYLGGSLGMPLYFIPETYGAWSANFDLTGYFTNDDAIPGNRKDSFLVGSLGISVGF